jgi:hypothetical protein
LDAPQIGCFGCLWAAMVAAAGRELRDLLIFSAHQSSWAFLLFFSFLLQCHLCAHLPSINKELAWTTDGQKRNSSCSWGSVKTGQISEIRISISLASKTGSLAIILMEYVQANEEWIQNSKDPIYISVHCPINGNGN